MKWRSRGITFVVIATIALPSLGHAQAREKQRESWLGPDKLKHFFISAFIESVTFSGLQAAGSSRGAAFAGAIGATAAVGIGREIHDRKTKGLFSIGDLAWDAAGAGGAVLLLRKTQR